MNGKERPFSPPAIGGSSLLVIFAVLCLTVFALLSLSTVKAGTRLSEKRSEAVRAYYEADSRAEEILARLRLGELPEGVELKGDIYAYECSVSDAASLAVELRLNGEDWEVLRWQLIPASEWEADDSLPVWIGD
ncbi:MAG TPA: hypothetical protein PLO47_01840 [Bacillota bacterium]|nr:hypothetical protein [Bacillota bacterium]